MQILHTPSQESEPVHAPRAHEASWWFPLASSLQSRWCSHHLECGPTASSHQWNLWWTTEEMHTNIELLGRWNRRFTGHNQTVGVVKRIVQHNRVPNTAWCEKDQNDVSVLAMLQAGCPGRESAARRTRLHWSSSAPQSCPLPPKRNQNAFSKIRRRYISIWWPERMMNLQQSTHLAKDGVLAVHGVNALR